jgi:DNA-directed RNA polymerase subunit RPC12/RpoP
MEYICTICKKNYASYQSLWIHNKKFHNEILEKMLNTSKNIYIIKSKVILNDKLTSKKYKCNICNNEFNSRQSKWYHEKKCKNVPLNVENKNIKENNKLEEKINNIENKINIIESKPNITNINYNTANITNNTANITNNTIIINKLGYENIDILSYDEIKTIFRAHANCVIELVNLLNFNDKGPENHSFCVTSLEGKYVQVYNTDKNQIEKKIKKNFYDEILNASINTMYKLLEQIKNKVSLKKKKKLESMIDRVYKLLIQNKYKITYNNEINLISYNNRNLVLDTWQKVEPTNLIEDDDSDSDDSSKDSFYYCSESD